MPTNRWSPWLLLYGGKVFGDRGYIAKSPMKRLWWQGLHLPLPDQPLLRAIHHQNSLCQFAKLKSGIGSEQSRHRSPINAFVRILSCLAACSLAPAKVNIGTVAIPNPS